MTKFRAWLPLARNGTKVGRPSRVCARSAPNIIACACPPPPLMSSRDRGEPVGLVVGFIRNLWFQVGHTLLPGPVGTNLPKDP